MSENRPDPDKLLEEIQREASHSRRGRLKIYLGMAAGVGKTYAMLADALIEKSRGKNVLAGYIEPHGRSETEMLALRLPSLPAKRTRHRGMELKEFDLEAALERSPALLLVDELPHSCAPGSKHAKRWQDIEEVLDHGIDVWTTVNVQHIESLTDVVSQITGVLVQETVPDAFFAKADEVEMIDTPPEELIQRLRDGKVYVPGKVEAALANFFKKGNLLALRELALRQTASRVEAEMDSFRSAHRIKEIWPAGERVLVLVGPNRLAERVVKTGRRIAGTMHAQLLVVYVESLRYSLLSQEERRLAFEALELGEQLGADTIYRQSADIAAEVLSVAQERNVGLIVMGKPLRPRWKEFFFGSTVDEMMKRCGNIHLHVVTGAAEEGVRIVPLSRGERLTLKGALFSGLVVSGITALCFLLGDLLQLSDVSMALLAGIAYVSAVRTFWEAALAAVLAVGVFDFFFVPPRFTFAVSRGHYVLTFVVMFVISLLISRLTTRIRLQAKAMSDRERRTGALFDLTRRLTAAVSLEDIREICREEFRQLFDVRVELLAPNAGGVLSPAAEGAPAEIEDGVALWTFEHRREAGVSTDTLPGSKGLYLPLLCRERCLGVLAVLLRGTVPDLEHKRLMEAFANQLALAVERIRVEEENDRSRISIEQERLRSSLLSSISHDLRTPLAAISGAASGLLQDEALSEANRRELALTISEESDRLSRMVRNVLDITRLESGSLKLEREWHSLEELLGSALERSRTPIGSREISIQIPPGFPLVLVDGLLYEQLFVNLFENFGKHTPQDAWMRVSARLEEPWTVINFEDNGPGLPPGAEKIVFEKHFTAAKAGSFGLGLFIARGIAEAHGGRIAAANRTPQGACFELRLPYAAPPAVEDDCE